ncbi:MAG TPA: glycyl-radical enzyme activating protein [Synergistaceae bacterium]|jgi:pyruvate formate lyase activating enzyme|nr:glycyl-radical enzyme activating protein [Synergistaceae bacterium]
MEKITGMIFDIKRYSIHDGPGIRTTFFLKGCPLSCWWCHNPEGISAEPVMTYRAGRCISCGECIAVCPTGAWSRRPDGTPERDMTKCTSCRACERRCPTTAIQFAGRTISVADVVAEAKKDIPFFDASGGGVTFSGGEPILQPLFLGAALQALREEGIHTAVDTSGCAPEQDLLRIAEYTDLFLFDVKIVDQTLHELYTNAKNDHILSNLKALDAWLAKGGQKNISIRIPLIPGVNDSEAGLLQAITFIRSLRSVQSVHILPYHSAGSAKYRNIGMEYRMGSTQPPSAEEVERVLALFRGHGIDAVQGG